MSSVSNNVLDVTSDNESDYFEDDYDVTSSQALTQSSVNIDDQIVEFVNPVEMDLLNAGCGALPYTNEYLNMITHGMQNVSTRKKFKLQLHQLIVGLVGSEIQRGPVVHEEIKFKNAYLGFE